MYEKLRRFIRQLITKKELGFLKLSALPEVLDPGVRQRRAYAKAHVRELRAMRQALRREICISLVPRKINFLKIREPQQVSAI